MFDQTAFNNLNDGIKFKLYEESVNLVKFLQDIVKDLSSKSTNYSDVTKGYLSNNSASQAPSIPPLNEWYVNTGNVNNQPQSEFPFHLSLSKNTELKGIIIGDSLSKRIVADQVGQGIAVRGYGGAKAHDILERVKNSRLRRINDVAISVRVNNCMD